MSQPMARQRSDKNIAKTGWIIIDNPFLTFVTNNKWITEANNNHHCADCISLLPTFSDLMKEWRPECVSDLDKSTSLV